MHLVEITRVAQEDDRRVRTHRRWRDTRTHCVLDDTHSLQGGREILRTGIAQTFFDGERQCAGEPAHSRQNDRLLRSVLDLARRRQADDWLGQLPYTHLNS